jgi:hypothetical protein
MNVRRKPKRKDDELGRQWAEKHFLMPGRPEPLRYGNLSHDDACAHRWNELTGRFPSWFTHLVERADGWWILNAEGAACDCGPYDTKAEALDDARGMKNFAKYHNKPGYVTSEKKSRKKSTTEAGKRGVSSMQERGKQRKKRHKP